VLKNIKIYKYIKPYVKKMFEAQFFYILYTGYFIRWKFINLQFLLSNSWTVWEYMQAMDGLHRKSNNTGYTHDLQCVTKISYIKVCFLQIV